MLVKFGLSHSSTCLKITHSFPRPSTPLPGSVHTPSIFQRPCMQKLGEFIVTFVESSQPSKNTNHNEVAEKWKGYERGVREGWRGGKGKG